MRNIISIIVVGISCNFVLGQDSSEPFSYLTKLEIGPDDDRIDESISFDTSITTVANKKLSELDKTDPYYAEECDGDMIKMITTKINSSSNQEYVFIYNLTCCCSWGYTIYKKGETENPVARITASQLYIPGNGNIYSVNRIATDYLVRKKFTLVDGSLKEVKQPLNYVGIKSKTLRPIKLYGEKEMTTVIADLPADYEVEILLSDKEFGDKKMYLVRTNFGLVGWTTLEAGQYQSIDVEGLFYWGS
jgi:hypothetical protein